MLEYEFKSLLGLGFLGCSIWHFLKLVVRVLLLSVRFLLHLLQLVVSANEKTNAISTLSNLKTELGALHVSCT